MDISHSTAIHISMAEVHDQTEDLCTLQTLPHLMLWHKYDARVASLYFYMIHICDVIFHQTFCFENFCFIFQIFKYLSRQDRNDECILLEEMQQSQPH